MVKSIRVSARVYEELKKIKGKAKSFSRVISEILGKKPGKTEKLPAISLNLQAR